VLSVVFRCETHATDSTFAGCRAKSAATAKLGAIASVIDASMPNRSSALATWSATSIAWCAAGSTPKSSTSAMWLSQVSGNQFPACASWKAQRTPSTLSPFPTISFSVT